MPETAQQRLVVHGGSGSLDCGSGVRAFVPAGAAPATSASITCALGQHNSWSSSLQESPAYLDENGYRGEAVATLESLKCLDAQKYLALDRTGRNRSI